MDVRRVRNGLDGPSKTIIVEPVTRPVSVPKPVKEPVPA